MGRTLESGAVLSITDHVGTVNVALNQIKNFTDSDFKEHMADVQALYADGKSVIENFSRICGFFPGVTRINNQYIGFDKNLKLHFLAAINSCQAHDIISQKAEHMISINEKMQSELSAFDGDTISLPYLSLIEEVHETITRQLRCIEKEYTGVLNKIRDLLTMLKKETEKAANIELPGKVSSDTPEDLDRELLEYVKKCSALSEAIGNKIKAIKVGEEFIQEVSTLRKKLKDNASWGGMYLQNLARHEDKVKAIETMIQSFTMESEREILKEVMANAGYQVYNGGGKKRAEGGVDLF